MTDMVYIVASVDISGAAHIHSVYSSPESAYAVADKLAHEMKWLNWTVLEAEVNNVA